MGIRPDQWTNIDNPVGIYKSFSDLIFDITRMSILKIPDAMNIQAYSSDHREKSCEVY